MEQIKQVHNKKMIAPKLRFKGFGDSWSQKKLNTLAEINPSNKNLPEKFIYIDLESVVKGQLLKENEILKDGSPSRAQRYLQQNDILFQMVRPYQMNNLFFDKIGYYVASTGYAQIRTKENSKYIYQYLHLQTFVDKVIEKCTGTSYPSINSKDLGNIQIGIPSLPEQQKIASFLSAVDEKIQLLNRKKQLLEQYKKGVMQQLFSGKLRFKDENGKAYPKWEEKKLGDVLDIGSGRDYKHLSDGDIPVFGTGGLMTKVNEFLYDGETVCIGRKGTIDKPMYYNGKIWTVDTLFYTHKFKNSIPKFVYFLFQQVNWKLYNEASGVPSLSKATIEKLKFHFPSIEEQKKIADFLAAIDVKIESLSNQINQTQTFKKGLLQQMFV